MNTEQLNYLRSKINIVNTDYYAKYIEEGFMEDLLITMQNVTFEPNMSYEEKKVLTNKVIADFFKSKKQANCVGYTAALLTEIIKCNNNKLLNPFVMKICNVIYKKYTHSFLIFQMENSKQITYTDALRKTVINFTSFENMKESLKKWLLLNEYEYDLLEEDLPFTYNTRANFKFPYQSLVK